MSDLLQQIIFKLNQKERKAFLSRLDNLPSDINFDQIVEAIKIYTVDVNLQTEIKANRAKEVTRIIECGLWLLPKCQGRIYRGMVFDSEGYSRFINKIETEKILKTDSIASFTLDVKTAQIFATPSEWYPEFCYSVLLKISKNISGVDVQEFHQKYKSYQEILISSGIRYKVLSVNKSRKYCEIFLEEIT